ncbi:MAG: bifunctional 2-polyprenyl-6-hydroxyphenol methylase/3-demethylubiquinol 3-O-methyltransferase UbiG [Acetobacteraceae bacterium]
MNQTSADAAEIARFGELAQSSWDPKGPMRPLHRMNALRVGWIASRIRHAAANPAEIVLLDVGCGAGLAAVALAREGFKVLGIDPSARMIAAAKRHAAGRGLALSYQAALPEDLVGQGMRFGTITALEVIEHVTDPNRFVAALASLLAPGGLLFLSTMSRTARSLLAAKIGAEYVLRLLPRGTHDWRRFITPPEMRRTLAASGLRLADIAGMTFDPVTGVWKESRDTAINYIVMAVG